MRVAEAFELICRYAEREGWLPIGWRVWTVGDWEIRVNGTATMRDAVPPWHAAVTNTRYLGVMVVGVTDGVSGGYHGVEEDFIRDMRAALGDQS